MADLRRLTDPDLGIELNRLTRIALAVEAGPWSQEPDDAFAANDPRRRIVSHDAKMEQVRSESSARPRYLATVYTEPVASYFSEFSPGVVLWLLAELKESRIQLQGLRAALAREERSLPPEEHRTEYAHGRAASLDAIRDHLR